MDRSPVRTVIFCEEPDGEEPDGENISPHARGVRYDNDFFVAVIRRLGNETL